MGYPHPHHREQQHHELMQDAAELLYSPPGGDYRHQKAENQHQWHAPQRLAETHTRVHEHNPAMGGLGALLGQYYGPDRYQRCPGIRTHECTPTEGQRTHSQKP
jgi:hypothetical protein